MASQNKDLDRPPSAADWVQDIVVGMMQSESVEDAKESLMMALERMIDEAVKRASEKVR